jgi:hypothetical protein
MVLVVKKPIYTKVTTATGNTESVHTFGLESDWIVPGSSLSNKPPAEVLVVTLSKESVALNTFLTEFLRLTAQYFAKPYSVTNVLRTLKHVVEDSTANGSLSFQPKEIQITMRGFQIHWNCKQEIEQSPLISLPDMEAEAEEEELDIPLSNTNEVIQLQTPNTRHIYDRQKVKEANLRAKLAQYKANRTHLEYIEKYGTDLSDSEDSETEESDDSE